MFPNEEGGLAGLKTPEEDKLPFDPSLLDPHGVLGARGVFPGHSGLPFRGEVPDLKEDDPEHKQPQVGAKAHVAIYDLSDVKQLSQYEKVMQLCAQRFAAVSAEERVYDPESKNWRIFLRWCEYYSYVPKTR